MSTEASDNGTCDDEPVALMRDWRVDKLRNRRYRQFGIFMPAPLWRIPTNR